MRTSDNKSSAGTVTRIVRVLRFLSERQETTIRDASQSLSLAPSTVHRLFELLVQEGIVTQNKQERTYSIGTEFFRISNQVVARFDVRGIALPLMREITAACDETCILGLYLPKTRKMIFAERIDSSQLLRYELAMNTPLSVLWGASGRSILAYLPQEQVEKILEEEGPAPASQEKPPSAAKLKRELAHVREKGFAVTQGEKIAGAVGVAAPFFSADGQVIGNLSVTAPRKRMHANKLKQVSSLVRQKAVKLSKALGYANDGAR